MFVTKQTSCFNHGSKIYKKMKNHVFSTSMVWIRVMFVIFLFRTGYLLFILWTWKKSKFNEWSGFSDSSQYKTHNLGWWFVEIVFFSFWQKKSCFNQPRMQIYNYMKNPLTSTSIALSRVIFRNILDPTRRLFFQTLTRKKIT